MIIDVAGARYLLAVTGALAEGRAIRTTDECPECGQVVDRLDSGEHIVAVAGARLTVAVGCEGYWVVDPASVGINAPTWQPAPQQEPTTSEERTQR